MESLRHASYRAASLLRSRALPVARVASRFTIKDSRLSQQFSPFSSLQHRLLSPYEDGERRSYDKRRNQGANLSQQGEQQPTQSIYVGNLFFDVTPGQLRQHFESYGEIEKVNIVTSAEGHSKGFGFINFTSIESAVKAKEAANLSVFAGRRILVHFARDSPRRRDLDTGHSKAPSSTLFIGNLHYDLSDKELNELFRPLRDIRDVRVSIDKRTGQPRGFAHADFYNVEAAIEGLSKLQGREVKGRNLRVDYGIGKTVTNNSGESSQGGKTVEGLSSGADASVDQTPASEQHHEAKPEGTSQPAENLEDHPETEKEKEFEHPEQQPEEQLEAEVEKTPENQSEDKTKQ